MESIGVNFIIRNCPHAFQETVNHKGHSSGGPHVLSGSPSLDPGKGLHQITRVLGSANRSKLHTVWPLPGSLKPKSGGHNEAEIVPGYFIDLSKLTELSYLGKRD